MIVYQIETRGNFIFFEHFKNKRKALQQAREYAKADRNDQVVVRKIDTGKASPFDLIKMFGDIDTESFMVGLQLPNNPNTPIASSEYIWEYCSW